MNNVLELIKGLMIGLRILFWVSFLLGILGQFRCCGADVWVISSVRCFFVAAVVGGIGEPACLGAYRAIVRKISDELINQDFDKCKNKNDATNSN